MSTSRMSASLDESAPCVRMPKLGLTMTEATIVEWHKQDGERVEKGELLFTIETDKVTLDIESPATGVLRILVPEGETVPVLEPIGLLGAAHRAERAGHRASPRARALARRLGVSLEGIAGTGPRGMIVAADIGGEETRGRGWIHPGDKGTRVDTPGRRGDEYVPYVPEDEGVPGVPVSPVARRMAEAAGLDLSTLVGSGPQGRVMRQDVERVMAQQAAGMSTSWDEYILGSGSQAGRAADLVAVPRAAQPEKLEPESVRPLSGLRAVIAERLTASWRERPHVTLTTEADATNLVSARQQAMAELDEKVSYDAFLVMLTARVLREQPHMNVRLTERGIEYLAQINIGIAVDTERGLLVPVVRDVASKNLVEVHRAVRELVERAVTGRSLPDDLTGGTFTITNLGQYEIDAFTPIINPPECAVLGVGRIVSRPVASREQVVLRDVVTLSLSFDHRLVDGAPAARFLQRVKQMVERPFALAFP